jgi:Ca2+-binding RTX toxin-like protein
MGGASGGFDRLLFVGAHGPVAANLATGHASGDGHDTITGLEGILVLRSSTNDLLIGDGRSNFVLAGAGNDQVETRAGNDVVLAQTGSDFVSAGEGNDFVDVHDRVEGNDAVNGGPGTDSCKRDAHDVRRNCESRSGGTRMLARVNAALRVIRDATRGR